MGWNDISKQSGEGTNDNVEVKWAELKTGTTVQLRALDDEPFSRWVHWIQAANGGTGMTVNCCGKGCPACAEIARRKATKTLDKTLSGRKQHAMNFIQRKLGTDGKIIPGEIGDVVVVDKGKRFFEGLSAIREEMGDLRGYDVKMRIAGEELDIAYTPIPLPLRPLNDAEKALVKYDFDKIFPKLNAEQISELMNGANISTLLGNDTTSDEAQPDVDFTQK